MANALPGDWAKRNNPAVYGLSAARIVLCMMPQNDWLSASAPLSWGIWRNIPFALLGMLIGMPILCALVAIILTPRHQKRIRRIN